MRTKKTCRRGQAMIEMAIGMLVFALILGGLISFGSIIPESMRLQTMVRRMAGYDAQKATSGEGDGAPMLALESVLSEPEIRPVSAPEPFSDALTRPFDFRKQSLNFAISIDPGTAEWIWGGETSFRGLEECHMPVFRKQSLNFAVSIDPGTAEWIWGGETTFRGLEECHMPVMTIPEFPAEEVIK